MTVCRDAAELAVAPQPARRSLIDHSQVGRAGPVNLIVRRQTLKHVMQIINRANLSSEQLAQVASELAEHRTLTDVLNWGFKQPKGTVLPKIVEDVIVQDEYSHDVIVPWSDGLVIVYGTT